MEGENMQRQASPGGLQLIGDNPSLTVSAGSEAIWQFQLKSSESAKHKVELRLTIRYAEGAPEWDVKMADNRGVLWDSGSFTEPKADIFLEGTQPRPVKIIAQAPRGARYGDTVNILFDIRAGEGEVHREFSATAVQSIMVLKTSIGHERNVMDGVASKAKTGEKGIFAMLSPGKLDGYVFIEAMNTDLVRETVRGVRKSKGIVEGETKMSEIEHFLTPKPLVSGIVEGDVVELVTGPFKGEKARVQKIDQQKEEITVELFEATVPIPVTVRGDNVRLIDKEK
jgi:transcriptional antiterminator NusG